MTTVWRGVAGLVAAGLFATPAVRAQTTTMPSTLRYGSGLMDIPVASVLPHMAITGTFSGFFVDLERTVVLNDAGDPIGYGPGVDKFYQDASLALGLFDRVEVGTTIQSLSDADAGGKMWGLFGRVQLVRPRSQGIGLAAGARYVTAPTFGDGKAYQPPRLGFPDPRFQDYPARSGVDTELSLYGVASAHFRGSDAGILPKHDLTVALGYGTGMFQDEGDLGIVQYSNSSGWFFGSALHFGIGDHSILTVMGEFNGFDVNVGTQLDVNGIRLGAMVLGANYDGSADAADSPYRKPKFALLGSLALCPAGGRLMCGPRLMERPETEVVQLPAPPPDTVIVTREVQHPLPSGTPALVCLATGESLQVQVSAQGDTLVGPGRAPIASLRPGLVYAGTYAGEADWYRNDEPVTFETGGYERSGDEARLDCGEIVRVGAYRGVPLFARTEAERPFGVLYVPVRPGVWVAYQARRGGG